MLCQRPGGSILKKLITEAAPQTNDDHYFFIIAVKSSGMSLKQNIKNLPWLYNLILAILNATNYFDWQFSRRFKKYTLTPYWAQRIAAVKASSDNERLSH